MDELISFLQNQDVEYQKGKILANCSSVGIGGAANLFITPNSKEKFTKTLFYLSNSKIPFRVVGNMSNLLFSDNSVKTVLVSTVKINRFYISEADAFADCGVMFSKLILALAKSSLGGCEALFGIPGTIGAMISINAGAYGASMSEFLKTVDVYDSVSDTILTLKSEDIAFFYRDSELKRQGLTVLGAKIKFLPMHKRDIDLKICEIKKQRNSTQPTGLKTLGSVFKRTEKMPASYMIDRCGLKGARIGKIVISEKHAGFFVNEGGGTCEDFIKLSNFVKAAVKEKYDVILEEEFEYVE